MKLLKKLIIIILLIIISIVFFFTYRGYIVYKNALNEISVADKIKEIESKENYARISEMPDFYLNAVVATEDRRFYEHGAVDYVGIARAIFTNLKSKELKEGGSTITQQLAKNIYFTQEKSALRKIAEIFMAYEIERNCDKGKVLELYLNTSYFGDGYYCAKDASKGFFNKDLKDMTRNESSMLAGLPNAPSAYTPTKHPDLALKRQGQVLDKMIKCKYITDKEKDEILNESNNAIDKN